MTVYNDQKYDQSINLNTDDVIDYLKENTHFTYIVHAYSYEKDPTARSKFLLVKCVPNIGVSLV